MPPAMRSTGTYVDAKTGKRVAVGPRPLKTALKRPLFLLPLLALVTLSAAQDQRDMRVRARQDGPWTLTTSDINPLTVELAAQHLGAFGDLIVTEKTPVVQMDFVYGIHPQLSTWTVTNSAAVDTSTGMLRLQSGTDPNGTAAFFSKSPARYRAGQGITARFSVIFATAVANSTQTVGMGDNGDGYFFGFNGTQFGILHKNRGVEDWIPQSSWNGDTCDGNGASGFNWDKKLGNVVQIVYPYLGFGNIKFMVQNHDSSRFILAHTIEYNNSHDHTQVSNPSLRFKAYVGNSGNTGNIKVYIGSVGIFVNGKREYLGPQFGAASIKGSVSTEASLIAIRNASSLNGVVNTGVLRLRSLTFANDNGNAIGKLRMIKGAAIGGAPVFTPVRGTTADNGVTLTSAESCASYDVVGTTGTSGYSVFNTLSSRNTNVQVDLTPYNLFIFPGETVIFGAESSLATSFGLTINWNEDN